jgi:hypothetical protein
MGAEPKQGGVMKSSRIILRAFALVAAVAAAAFAGPYFLTEPVSSRATFTKTVTRTVTKTVLKQPCGDRIYGHITTLAQKGDGFELHFDPAWFTSGLTANTAAAEDGAVPKGEPVPNDNYVVEEGHRSLGYLLPASAQVTVLAKGAALDDGGFPSAEITVAELGRIVNGGAHRPLFEPLDSGVWIRVHVDTVCSVEQQYRP